MTTKDLCLKHLVRPSSLSTLAPTIIMLHGYGSNAEDLFSFSPELDERYLILSVQAPLDMVPYGHAWYEINFDGNQNKFTNDEQAIASRELVHQFIQEALEAYPVNPQEITLLGFSQGAILSYATALSYPGLVKNVIALSGYIHEPIIKSATTQENKVEIYGSHGSVDQVIPVSWARKNKDYLAQKNIAYTYSEFPVGHGVCPPNFQEFKQWLTQRTNWS